MDYITMEVSAVAAIILVVAGSSALIGGIIGRAMERDHPESAEIEEMN